MVLDTFIKGIIIGLSISIPMGPIGMLCIQRTLNRGQKFGIVTGLGATLSDLIYSVVTMFFLNVVIGFVEERRMIIQIIGSIIIVLFGLWIFNSHPSKQPLPDEKQNEHSLLSDFFTSTALTLSNPLILFVLIALFAQFDFINENLTIWGHAFALFSILAGAAVWWITLTGLVSRFRYRFNIRGLKMLNRLIGGVIMVIGVIGTVLGMVK